MEIKGRVWTDRPREEVYAVWRNPGNLSRLLPHIHQVEEIPDGLFRWTIHLPSGEGLVQWNTWLVEDIVNERMAWRSVEGAEILNQGELSFFDAPEGEGTEIEVFIHYSPVAKPVGEVAELFSPAFRYMLSHELDELAKPAAPDSPRADTY